MAIDDMEEILDEPISTIDDVPKSHISVFVHVEKVK